MSRGDAAAAELHTRLAADIAALSAATDALDQPQADWRAGVDRWSIGEILHHLVISNRYFAARIAGLIERGRTAGTYAASAARQRWPRLRLIADRNSSGPVKSPAGATPTAGLPIARLRSELLASHCEITDQIERTVGLDLAALTARHPLGLELNLFQLIDAAGAHERRHLAQIEEIKAAVGFPIVAERSR